MYIIADMGNELRQGEIISNLVQHAFNALTSEVEFTVHPHAIVLSQDCDLLWDFNRRRDNAESDLNGVLLYELELTERLRERVPGGDVVRLARRHGAERYHCLEAVPAENDASGTGIPELFIDFKRFFTLPPAEIYRQCALVEGAARRRCRLDSPYREHLQNRAAAYLQRVALPDRQA